MQPQNTPPSLTKLIARFSMLTKTDVQLRNMINYFANDGAYNDAIAKAAAYVLRRRGTQ